MAELAYRESPCANTAGVSEIRESKLRRLRFRRSPNAGREFGEAMNFLSADLIDEFKIPADPPVSDHAYGEFFGDMLRENPDKLFLDIGAGLRSGVSSNMVNMDIYPSVSTDIVCVGEDLPFDSDQFDFVVCAAVLEHTRRPWDVASEICRVTKPGGTIKVDYPFISTVHGYPNHYFNATPEGVISLFERFCVIASSTVEANNHPIQALWWILSAWRHGLPEPDLAAFDTLTLGGILSRPPHEQLEQPFCRALSAEIQRVIPAGSSLVAVKKQSSRDARDPLADAAALRRELDAVRRSRSWRWTAPLRVAWSAARRG